MVFRLPNQSDSYNSGVSRVKPWRSRIMPSTFLSWDENGIDRSCLGAWESQDEGSRATMRSGPRLFRSCVRVGTTGPKGKARGSRATLRSPSLLVAESVGYPYLGLRRWVRVGEGSRATRWSRPRLLAVVPERVPWNICPLNSPINPSEGHKSGDGDGNQSLPPS